MKRTSPTEAALDEALAIALKEDREFAKWFWSRTRFSSEQAQCVLVRSDNPWSVVKLADPNADVVGSLEEVRRQCETDVLAVFETQGGKRVALHIENKLADGVFTELQPELYRARLTQWRMKPRLGMYAEATSVLTAPLAFYERHRTGAGLFEAFVSHEDIAVHLSTFRSGAAGAA
jgi:hypothetical protein